MAWNDARNGNNDIYAQRLNADGIGLWPSNGIPICTVLSDERIYTKIKMIEGGGSIYAIIVWEDTRNGDKDIFAQLVDGSGNIVWSENGIPTSDGNNDQHSPIVISNIDEEFFIVWRDEREYWSAMSSVTSEDLHDVWGLSLIHI